MNRMTLAFLVCMIAIYHCNAQTSYFYEMDTSILHFTSQPPLTGGKYLSTDYSKVSKPLVVEHFKTNCRVYDIASQKHTAAGSVTKVLFGGDQPSGYGQPACVFTKQTFDKNDFPICLETEVYSTNDQVQYNEAYFWIGPSNYVYFSSPTYNFNGEHFQKEGVSFGGRPWEYYVDNYRSETQASQAVTSKKHNISSSGKWYTHRIIIDYSGTTLILREAYIDDQKVFSSPVNISGVTFLDDYRLAVCTDDLIKGFKIVLNYGQFVGKITASDSVICEGDSINFTSTTSYDASANAGYEWYFEGGIPSSSVVQNPGWIRYSKSGKYLVRLIATKGTSSDTVERTMEVKPPPPVVLDRDTILCSNNFEIVPLQTFKNRWWSDGSTGSTLEVTESGEYSVLVSDGVCLARDTIQVDLRILNVFLGNDTTICFTNSYVLDPKEKRGALLWSDSSNGDTLVVDEPGKYWVRATWQPCVQSDTIEIFPADSFPLDLGADTVLCLRDTLHLDITHLPAGITGLWSDGMSSNLRLVTSSGRYSVMVKGCIEQHDTIQVDFEECCHFSYWIPNAFSPTGDGLNEVFRISFNLESCTPIEDFQFRIYDLWGGLIYTGNSFHEGWDGTAQKELCKLGSYVWIANFKQNNQVYQKSGTVMLMR